MLLIDNNNCGLLQFSWILPSLGNTDQSQPALEEETKQNDGTLKAVILIRKLLWKNL